MNTEEIIRRTFHQQGFDQFADTLVGIGKAESNLNPYITTPIDNVGATGIWQFVRSTWRGLEKQNPALGPINQLMNESHERFVERQTLTVIALTKKNLHEISSQVAIPPHLMNRVIYAAHHVGAGTVAKALKRGGDFMESMQAVIMAHPWERQGRTRQAVWKEFQGAQARFAKISTQTGKPVNLDYDREQPATDEIFGKEFGLVGPNLGGLAKVPLISEKCVLWLTKKGLTKNISSEDHKDLLKKIYPKGKGWEVANGAVDI